MSNDITTTDNPTPNPPPARNPWRTFSITLIVLLVLGGVGYWLVSVYLFPTSFSPVTLNQKEQQRLDAKLDRLSGRRGPITPEKYTEDPAKRTIEFSEKELNALLAKNTDLASKLAIDLSDNLASAKLLIDVDPDAPILGGQTIKVTAGMELSIQNGQPRAVLKGVSVWGVPLPNAWIGNMKNRDMMKEFGQAGGFWQAIREGVEEIEVREGKLRIKLRE
jgi:hypothetical protein